MSLSSEAADRTRAEFAQAKLLAALSRPGGGGPVEAVVTETAGGAVRTGAIFGPDGAALGRIRNFQIDFVRPGDAQPLSSLREQSRAGVLPRKVEAVEEWRLIPHDAEEFRYEAPRIATSYPEIVVLDRPGRAVSFDASGRIELLLFAHPWSGEVEVAFGGRSTILDLYAPHTVISRPLKLDLGPRTQRVEIAVLGRNNPLSAGRQCLFGGFRRATGRMAPLRHAKQTKVRGAEFNSAFDDLLASVPEDGLLLDLGGGNRQLDDSRYINLDYADYEEPDLIGDATKLPLADASIDAVYSTGVFEHINDPAKAGAEVARVLKSGGKAVVGWAFMQPIHSEGQHFYNATPWGVERAFAALKLKRMWYETSFEFLVRWGAAVSGLVGRAPAEEIESVCAALARWDKLIPETHKQYMANGVWAEFEKA